MTKKKLIKGNVNQTSNIKVKSNYNYTGTTQTFNLSRNIIFDVLPEQSFPNGENLIQEKKEKIDIRFEYCN